MSGKHRRIPTPGVRRATGEAPSSKSREGYQPGRAPEQRERQHDTYDYVVIGAGSAGCVIANRLVEDDDISVLLLEAGPPDTDPRIHIPGDFSQLWFTDLDWKYMTEPVPYLMSNPENPQKGRSVPWPRGRVLGGSGSISSMVYMRGNHRDYDTWAYLGNERWSYKDVLPYFKKAEDQERGPDEYHGVNGPMRVSDIHPPNPATIAFADAAIQMGYRRNRDFNGRDQLGSGMVQVTIKYDPQNPDYSGRRVSSADAYLNPIKSRSNFTLKTNALVDSIVLEQKESKPVKASGVKYHLSDNVERVARARLEVIVCGGTVNSPKLLMLSGIGSGEHLRSLGIRPIVDLPGVGQNLQDHPLVAIGYRYSGGQKSKPPAAGAAEGSLFIHTRPAMEASAPDMQIHFAHWLLIDPQYLKLRSVAPDDGFAFVPTLVKPQGCGSITLRSSSPQDLPKIEPNYLQCDSDLEALLMAAKASRKLAHAKAFDPLRGDEVAPGVGCQTDDEWKQYIRLAAAALFHPVGSCKMGRDRMAVVDPRLRVHGVQGLRVVDASIMPIITSGNTHAPTVMIAEKAAQMIKDDQ